MRNAELESSLHSAFRIPHSAFDMKEWLALNMTPGIGPRAATKLLEHFGSAERVFGSRRRELEALRLRPETVDSILARDTFDKAAEEIDRVREMGADVLILDDGVYPALLKEIQDPPITLYVKGKWMECLDQPCVAMVGSRRCSTYGQNAALMLARDLAEKGVTIISGLARGIDAAAHRGALDAGGKTVAVLGTGLDQVYPRDHKKLVEEILESGGAIVSEFPLETPPAPQNFPYRNRVISGLSLGICVVEASEQSGSLITARLAMEQNREVFAVPGNITSKTSFGSNYLIKGAGAKLVQQWQDIAAELPPDIAAKLLPPPQKKEKDSALVEQLQLVPNGLTVNECAVWKLLSHDEPLHIDEIAEKTELSISELTGALFGLEVRELIRALPGKCYVKKM
jgi:DNA processing protein